jgi:hypothetical protein
VVCRNLLHGKYLYIPFEGGAFGQCVFAIVLQKLIDKYDWNGAMMIFSAIVLSIVAFGALFREVEWDEDDYDEEEGKLYIYQKYLFHFIFR